MADKNNKEDHNNTLNANPNEEQQEEEIEIDEELINIFRNGTDNRAPQDSNQPDNELIEGVQQQDGLNSDTMTHDQISDLMEENTFDEFDHYPPDDFDGEMWNIDESEILSSIKLPFAF